jgi:hypothetical protein
MLHGRNTHDGLTCLSHYLEITPTNLIDVTKENSYSKLSFL